MIKPAKYHVDFPNKALPKADTCFFNLELPAYTTREALEEKLLIAIHFCDTLDADDLVNLDPTGLLGRENNISE